MRNRILICSCFLIYLLIPQRMSAWGAETHKLITQSVILNSILANNTLLGKFNFERTIYFEMFQKEEKRKSLRDWVKYGADKEDSGIVGLDIDNKLNLLLRFNNHFHNPFKAWAEAGLNDLATGYSAILWAQLGHLQAGFPEGDNAWSMIRTYFYAALTSDNSVERNRLFAEAFKGLGHQIHLIQDMAVPDHVRNDAHPLNTYWRQKYAGIYRCIEGWAEVNLPVVQTFVDPSKTTILFPSINLNRVSPLPSLLPLSYLYDNDLYNPGTIPSTGLDLGLAEYANGNFVSEDTIFSSEDPNIPVRHQFPYPRKASTDLQKYIDEGKAPESLTAEDGKTDFVKYIAKTDDGDKCKYFLAVGYLADLSKTIYPFPPSIFNRTLFLDNLCHQDYASKLIPRAVGYSAKLLDYFFRGDIEITVPEEGVYAISENEDLGFSKITLLAENVTANGEEMPFGQVKLVVRYRKIDGNPFQSNPPIQERLEYFIVAAPKSDVYVSIPRDNPLKLEFDLPEPIPMNATDVTLQLVYKGTLGFEEESAVVVGFRDISEPTPMDVFNNMDKICLFNTWYDAGSQAAIDAVDKSVVDPVGNNNGVADEWDVTAHDLFDIYLNFNQTQASSAFHLTYKDMLLRANVYRVFLLADNGTFNMSIGARIDSGWTASLDPEIFTFPSVENRLKWYGFNPQVGGDLEYGDIYRREIYPGFSPFRTIYYHDLLIIINSPYPSTSECTYDLLNSMTGLSLPQKGASLPSGAVEPSRSTIMFGRKKNE